MKILQVLSSVRAADSNSTVVANRVVDKLKAANPAAELTVRDLGAQAPALLDGAAVGALFTPPEQRTPEQAARVAEDDALIAEIQAADVVVLGVPMYNLNVPAQLKMWFDAISRARVTFRYTANGPEGLLTGKKVIVAFARGGKYRGTHFDQQTPYLKVALGFLGMTDVQFVFAEGFAMGEEGAKAAFADADAQIAALDVSAPAPVAAEALAA
ncbi:FMN-dependent NADH-azoreductase [Derxia gummosa]|uniref:FMN dependent NADH:quinone oxidoreductase n=1 Tax=Derxia gummosa DSM 723 TaxID=1121388 RepID=A0A8B6X4J6_9BURK|nr:NAD(P)H-dependent oxidoreductase [Derxia gummosa]